jgi:hypothetical protein
MTPNPDGSEPRESRPTLTTELAGPADLELAKAVEKLPGRGGMPGGSRYEPKVGRLSSLNLMRSAGLR